MAEPLSGVAATATTGDGAVTGSAVSGADGTASIWLRKISRTQYLRFISIAVHGTKLGYNDGVGTLSSLPDYDIAKANGFDMTIYMQKGSASQLNVSPASLRFPSGGGTQTLTVTAPDDNWIIEATPLVSGFMVTKTSNTTMDVVCPAGGEAVAGYVNVKWGDQTRQVWAYRSASTTVGSVTFTGSVKNASTGAGVASASVTIRTTYTDGTTENAAITTANPSGSFTAAWEVDSATWGRVSSILVVVEAAGYQVNTVGLVSLPDYATATANPVALPDVNLTPAQSSWSVVPAAQAVAKSGGTATVNIQGTDGTEVFVYQKLGGQGYDGPDTANIAVSKSGSTITVTFGQNTYSYTRTVYIGVTWQGVQKYANITQN